MPWSVSISTNSLRPGIKARKTWDTTKTTNYQQAHLPPTTAIAWRPRQTSAATGITKLYTSDTVRQYRVDRLAGHETSRTMSRQAVRSLEFNTSHHNLFRHWMSVRNKSKRYLIVTEFTNSSRVEKKRRFVRQVRRRAYATRCCTFLGESLSMTRSAAKSWVETETAVFDQGVNVEQASPRAPSPLLLIRSLWRRYTCL
jgi:hypothetical protein